MSADDKKDKKPPDLPLAAEDFTPFAFALLGARSATSFKDAFGGQVFLVYRTFAKGLAKRIPSNPNDRRLYSEGDPEVINRMLPQAKEEFRIRLFEKLRMAADELAHEVLAPIYEATGLTWDMVYPVYIFKDDFTYQIEYRKRELKDGHPSYRTVKSPGGRPPQLEDAELEQRIRKAAVAFKKRNYGKTPTLKQVAEVLSKRQPITEPALKMRMKRAGMSWKEIKKVT